MLSKVHYEHIADAIQASKDKDDLIQMLCDYFERDDARFNRQVFEVRCKGADIEIEQAKADKYNKGGQKTSKQEQLQFGFML